MSATIALGFGSDRVEIKVWTSFLVGDKGKIGIEFPDRKLCWIPWFMKHVDGEEPELGDTGIDGTVGKGPNSSEASG